MSRGPFLEDDRLSADDDLFYFQTFDVTDQGLGEASRRILAREPAGTFSFLGGPIDFSGSPLAIIHGLLDAPLQDIAVPNVSGVSELEARVLAGLPFPRSWEELIDQCRLKYDRLLISDEALNGLAGEPFSPYVCERTFALLAVLQDYMLSRLPNGERSLKCNELVQNHFVGDKSWFSDKSARNKNAYRRELTFKDPLQGEDIFAPWHGKIKSPQYRIHFDWPVPPQTQRIRIVYLGPKITKT